MVPYVTSISFSTLPLVPTWRRMTVSAAGAWDTCEVWRGMGCQHDLRLESEVDAPWSLPPLPLCLLGPWGWVAFKSLGSMGQALQSTQSFLFPTPRVCGQICRGKANPLSH